MPSGAGEMPGTSRNDRPLQQRAPTIAVAFFLTICSPRRHHGNESVTFLSGQGRQRQVGAQRPEEHCRRGTIHACFCQPDIFVFINVADERALRMS